MMVRTVLSCARDAWAAVQHASLMVHVASWAIV